MIWGIALQFLYHKKPSGQDAHGCKRNFIALQYASGAKKVCFLKLSDIARVCEAHFFIAGNRWFLQ
jgi:hypothetical protein